MTVVINYVAAGGGSGGGGGGGAVSSVNGQTGVVVLTPLSLNAAPMPGAYTWNANTNVLTDGTNTTSLASGTIPTLAGKQVFAAVVSTPGTTTLDGNSVWNAGDIVQLEQSGGSQIWIRNTGNPTTTLLFKGDNAGGVVAAVPGVDYKLPAVYRRTLPLVWMPTVSVNSGNGALTLGTAVTAPYGVGYYVEGCYGYFAAQMITTTNTAGWYYCTFSSTTALQVYTNQYTPGTNLAVVPGSPTAFVGTAGATLSNTTGADVIADQITIAANAIGLTGDVTCQFRHRNNSSAGAKSVKTKWGGNGNGYANSQTTNTYNEDSARISNNGKTNRQVGGPSIITHSGANPQNTTVDTTASSTFVAAVQVAVATDWVSFEVFVVEINPGA